MKKITKSISVVIFLFLLWGIYLSIRTNQYESEVKTEFQPFIIACQSSQGCILNPENLGWEKRRKYDINCQCDISKFKNEKIMYEYYKNGMIYTATSNKFTITWHIMTDTELVANGGKNIPFEIITLYE